MNSSLRMILSAMGCLAGATAFTQWSGDVSDPESAPVEALSAWDEVQEFYNEAIKVADSEVIQRAGKLIYGQLAKGFLHEDKNWQVKINETAWLEHAHQGSISLGDAVSLATFVELCQPQNMLEIGSFLGISSNVLLRLMEPWGGHLTSVDPNVRHRVFDKPRDIFTLVTSNYTDRLHRVDAFWMQHTDNESGHHSYAHYPPYWDEATIKAIYQDRKTITPGDFMTEGKSFDMAFIDGAHDSVTSDFETVLKVMKPKACVVLNDFDEEAWPDHYNKIKDIVNEAFESEEALVLFGEKTVLFIDRGFIESRRKNVWQKPQESPSESFL